MIYRHCIILVRGYNRYLFLNSTDVLPPTNWENGAPVPYSVFSVNVGQESADVEEAFDMVAEFRERHFIIACHMDCVKEVFRQVYISTCHVGTHRVRSNSVSTWLVFHRHRERNFAAYFNITKWNNNNTKRR